MPYKTLTQWRLDKGWSMTQLERVSGVASTTIAAIERGAKPRISTIEKLSSALGCARDDVAWPGNPLHHDRKWFPTTFRQCLEWLDNSGSNVLELGQFRYAPRQLLIGTDLETAVLQAPAVLEMYVLDHQPEADEIVGNLQVEYVSTLGQSSFGTEVSFRRERYVVRYATKAGF